MISEALELHVEGGRVNHSWCVCVVSCNYDGLGGGREGGCGCYAFWISQGVVACREMPEHCPCAMISYHTAVPVGTVEPQLVCLLWMALTQNAMRMLWLVSMQLVGCTPRTLC